MQAKADLSQTAAPAAPFDPSRSVDVAVVGAGLAGLTAAAALVKQGLQVAVLEARDRVGGRTWSQQVAGDIYDMGGQWIGPGQKRIVRLAQELDLKTSPTFHAGRKILDLHGKQSTYAGSIPSLSPLNLLILHRSISLADKLCRRFPGLTPKEAAEYDLHNVEAWKRRHIPSRAVREVLDAVVRVIFGAEPAELSMLYFIGYLQAGGGLMSLAEIENGAQQDRFVAGSQGVALALAAGLGERVVLGAPVRRIVQDAGGVTLTMDDHLGGARGACRARYAVLAVPPTLAGHIDYEPLMPAQRDALTQRAAMGATTKLLAIYERPFWRDKGLSGEVVATGGPMTCVFDNSPPAGGHGALLGFSVGDEARRLALLPQAERRRTVLAALARYFGGAAAEPIDYHEMDWCTERWTRGCPTGLFGPSAMTTCGEALRQPVGRLHFAGTETATEWTGYMDGAIQSGERAAQEIASRVR